MKRSLMCISLTSALWMLISSPVSAEKSIVAYQDDTSVVGLWEDATKTTIGETKEYTNSLELADINGDGRVDILFANGGGYEEPGVPEFSRVFLNQGPGHMFKEVTKEVFGSEPMVAARAIRAADVNGDGNPDLVVGTSYQTQSQLYLGVGQGNFKNVSETHLPQIKASVGDLKFGDADGDGDLDLVLVNWGPGNPMKNLGGRTMLWLNDGTGHFTDVTEKQMPNVPAKFSWNLEFVDVDNDYDLDIMVSAKKSEGSFLFENDGEGNFRDVTQGRVPPYTNNYEIEAMDLNADGYLDVITMNDGEYLDDGPYARRNQIFINDGNGGFINATPQLWEDRDNPAVDDNLAVMLDYDSDGDPDVLVASLAGPDRILINDGTGHLRLHKDFMNSFTGDPTHGTLGMAVADLNGDGKLDVVQSQGEVPGYEDERVFLGKHIKVDTAPPVIAMVEKINLAHQPVVVRARVHDNKSPTMPHDWQSAVLYWTDGGQTQEIPMRWYGEYLWRATVDKLRSDRIRYKVCATDAAGNQACSLEVVPTGSSN
ncbi:MAG: VCBS repeat-containing protein [Desulfobacterales bacterium]|nr:MAG: VCBS repeat-containing protein [Desulfobacterales bacterium]